MITRYALVLLVVMAATETAGAQAPAPPAAPIPALNPNDYADEKNWLCRPGRKGDACDVDLTTTVVAADGTLTRETWAANPKAPIDCFYVYPTVSTDPGVFSDMTADPAETNVILQQFARFGSKCRTFAPMYRQLTLAGLRQRLSGGTISFDKGVWYDDVRDAGDLGVPGKPIPMWGLHLIDVNLVMGNLLASVDQQTKTYRSRH